MKFYSGRHALPSHTSLGVRGEIFLARFVRAVNVNFLEWRYHLSLRQRLPSDVLAVFPEHVELAYSETRGWGVVESIIANTDGTLAKCLVAELPRVSDPALRLAIYREAETLLEQIVKHEVRFYDIPNLLIQWTGHTSFRLRIADFEPRGRGGWMWLSCCRPLSRAKVRRRADRYLARLRKSVFEADRPAAVAATGGRRAKVPFVARFARMAGLF